MNVHIKVHSQFTRNWIKMRL